MKNTRNLFILFFVCAFISISSANISAQTVYGLSVVQYNPGPQNVEGLSATWLDYYAGYYYDPEVIGDLYRTDAPETSLDAGQDFGMGYWDDAVVELFTTNYVPGKTYCTFSQHAIWSYYVIGGGGSYWDPFGYSFMQGGWDGPWGGSPFGYYYVGTQRHFIGWTEACITIPIPPTPTPDPCDPQNFIEGCATPTPTPSPTPVPSPTVQISEVGFTGDRLIRRLGVSGEPYIDSPDGTTSTWKDNNNPDYPVAYLKGTSPILFAKFTIQPTLTSNVSAHVRIKRGGTIVTASNIPVTLTGSEIRVDNISIPFSNLESDQYVKMSKYKFDWEISFDNGSTWKDLGDQSEHKVHFLNSNPANEATFAPFKNFNGTTYNGLFDKALEWSTGKIENNESDLKKIIQKINSRVASKVLYKPGNPAVNDNPLKILRGEFGGGAVCQDNALILAGLLKSIGLDGVQEKYHWGGEESTGKRNYYCGTGGCPNATSFANRFTLQAKRDQLGMSGPIEFVEKNPQFTYHATVMYGADSFDPSYGIVEGTVELLTALKITTGQPPVCVHNAAATAQRVTRNTFGDDSIANNNSPGTICDPMVSSAVADIRNFRFNGDGGSQPATLRYSDGLWAIQDEFGEASQIQGYAKTSNQAVFLAADYDGDGLVDPAVWDQLGVFRYKASSVDYQEATINVGPLSDERALTGDYDGDGKNDIAKWRGSDGRYVYWKSSDGNPVTTYWGGSSLGDVPTPGDYDGDGKTDIAIYRKSNGQWWVLKSSDGQPWAVGWGVSEDIPVQGDYDGDGTTDFVVVRPSNGVWYMLESESGLGYRSVSGPTLGLADWPVPADYNKDGKTDVAVWFNDTGEWHIVDSQTGLWRTQILGRAEERPIQSFSVKKQ